MVTKLELYNMALGHLGPVRLGTSGLTENRPDRRELDAVYDGVVQAMLERGLWFFALRSVELEPDTNLDARFGLPYTYSFPEDYVRLRAICSDEAQTSEDTSYKREGAYLFSEHALLYLTYVSNDPEWGLDLGRWPQLFAEAVAAELAYTSGLPITKDMGTKANLFGIKKLALREAQRVDAVDERVKFKPVSSVVRARMGSDRSQRRARV